MLPFIIPQCSPKVKSRFLRLCRIGRAGPSFITIDGDRLKYQRFRLAVSVFHAKENAPSSWKGRCSGLCDDYMSSKPPAAFEGEAIAVLAVAGAASAGFTSAGLASGAGTAAAGAVAATAAGCAAGAVTGVAAGAAFEAGAAGLAESSKPPNPPVVGAGVAGFGSVAGG